MRREVRHFYEFGPFRLDAERHRLLRGGELVPLAPKDLETLLVLVRRAGEMLEREELMSAVWAGSFVEDANLTVAVSHLRKALGQDGGEYIETIPRVGYRFVADVREVREEPAPSPAALVVEKHTLSQTVIEEEFVQDEPGEAALAASAAVEPVAGVVAPPVASAKALPSASASPTANPPKRIVARVAAVAAVVALAVAGVFAYRDYNSERRPLTVGSVRSVAVLPLRALNAPEEDAYLGLGIADNLVSRLGGQRRLVVRPLSAVAKYDGNNGEAAEVARSLRVDAVLEGNFQRVGDRVRVFVQLVSARDSAVLWARTFDQKLSDALALQDAIAEQTAVALVPDLTGDERRQLARRPTENAEAYALYLKGRYFWNKRGDNTTKAIEYFRQAVALDPNFAAAYVGLAECYGTQSAPATEAEDAVRRALALDDTLAEAHASLGFIEMFQHWDWAGAETELRRAIELNPNDATAHQWYATRLELERRFPEAERELQKALEIDPLSLPINSDLCELKFFERDYDSAIAQCQRTLEFDPTFVNARLTLAEIYVQKGAEGAPMDEYFNFRLRDIPAPVQKDDGELKAYNSGGLQGLLRGQLEGVLRLGEDQQGFEFEARRYAQLGDKEEALRRLGMAYERHAFMLPFVNAVPAYDGLRSDPRFADIVRRVGLPQP
ncbi:MAG TPA: winged helix-turn-helix domain-containing protein [Pyrinomonadaceae bacterium]|nr:winged helix-turn-helix domain-containing protein [Pyrinomonadaceae bacterium]